MPFFKHLSYHERKYAAFLKKKTFNSVHRKKILAPSMNEVNESRPAYLLS
jgi:hypothetical protein